VVFAQEEEVRSGAGNSEVADFLSHSEGIPLSSVNLDVRIALQSNITMAWFKTVMAIINNVTVLTIILAGAAIIREGEHGTMDHAVDAL
jgi:ABC-2 type transport system permease protein